MNEQKHDAIAQALDEPCTEYAGSKAKTCSQCYAELTDPPAKCINRIAARTQLAAERAAGDELRLHADTTPGPGVGSRQSWFMKLGTLTTRYRTARAH